MAINLISGGVVPSAFLVGDLGQTPGGSADALPTLTQINGKPVSAALEVQSTLGILFPRMTTTQRNALNVTNGMQIYNLDTNAFESYSNNAWNTLYYEQFALGGNWTGPKTVGGSIYLTKIGNAVTMRVQGVQTTSDGITPDIALWTFDQLIPIRFLPTTNTRLLPIFTVTITGNTTGFNIGTITIDTTTIPGTITASVGIVPGFDGLTWSGGGFFGMSFNETSGAWTVQ